MKRYLYIILFALLGVSCDTVIDDIIGSELVEICVIADADECTDNRVNVDGNITKWEVGDRITLVLTSYGYQTIELEIKSSADISNSGKRAKFRGTVPTGKYYGVTAFYPAVPVSGMEATLDRNREDNIFMMSEIMDENKPVLNVKAGEKVELPIAFEHLMHKVDFNIILDESVSYDEIAVTMNAERNGEPLEFVESKSFDLLFHTMSDKSKVNSITVSGNTPKLSTMLFPMENTAGVAFNFDVYLDGVKRYEVRKPESGTIDNIAMHAGMYTTVNLDLSNNKEAECRAEMDCSVDARGVWAELEFSNIAYLVDDEPADIFKLKLEYARANSNEWIGCDFTSDVIINGVFEYCIPFEGMAYLEENSDYMCRLTLYPKDSNNYQPITSEPFKFNTKSAVVTADISAPQVNISEEKLNISVANATVYYDGIYIPNYGNVAYEFAYRKSGSNQWESLSTVTYNNSGYSGAYDVTLFEEGATYEIIGRVTVNSAWVFESEAATITIPNGDTPTPPTPPVDGEADTTAIAGDWHLTSWRGAEPSFDIYLSITTDGVISLYQRLDSRLWETYYSTVGFEDSVISGTYTDGIAWGTSYYVTINGDTMTWVDVTDSSDISIYTRCTLPDFTNPDIRVTSNTIERFL